MIIVRIIGGIGNQMFQYALARHLAHKNSTLLKMDLSGFENYKLHRYSLQCYNIWEYIASVEEIAVFKKPEPVPFFRKLRSLGIKLGLLNLNSGDYYKKPSQLQETGLGYSPDILEVLGNVYLSGYWQSEKYFINIRKILLREFSLKYDLSNESKLIADKIRNLHSVSIHIRRGDYASNQKTKDKHGLCTINYYKEAINYIEKRISNCHYLIFSDDINWVRENFKLEGAATYVDHNDALTNYEDLELMKLCQHNIIANSSFSWWGAWLGTYPNKIVIAPQKWFNDPTKDSSHIIPEHWIKL